MEHLGDSTEENGLRVCVASAFAGDSGPGDSCAGGSGPGDSGDSGEAVPVKVAMVKVLVVEVFPLFHAVVE